MTKVSMLTLLNRDAVIKELGNLETDVQTNVVAGMKEQTRPIAADLRSKLQIAADSNIHSSAGEAPMIQSGLEKDSIRGKVLPLMHGVPVTLRIYVGMKAFYAGMLEFGTSKIAPRPWFYPTMMAKFPQITGMVKAQVEKRIARSNAETKARKSEIMNSFGLK